ncbi:MAG: antibiotic biosynthesis monooxygenase [Desulfobacterales bacterium]|nr:antibiotic biosynthesis monooxygenase [Desulfobacterales bacterium]
MTVKVIIRRRFKDGNLDKASTMLIQARQNAMDAQGYIASETLRGCEDPNEILVLSMWQKKEDWDRYANSDVRMGLEQSFSEIMEGPSQSIAYELGMQKK